MGRLGYKRYVSQGGDWVRGRDGASGAVGTAWSQSIVCCKFLSWAKGTMKLCSFLWGKRMEGAKLNRRTFLRQSVVTSVTAISSRRIVGANDRISIAMIGCGTRNLLKEVLQFSQDTNVEVTAV
jgi:hypothetical protein